MVPAAPRRSEIDRCDQPPREDRWAHVGFHPQKQAGRSYVGVVLPVGRMTVEQVRGLWPVSPTASAAGTIRLTVWQNLLIPDIGRRVDRGGQARHRGSRPRLGRVECPERPHRLHGQRRLQVRRRRTPSATRWNWPATSRIGVTLDAPINIHVTGCHNSCAQHYIGDIGLEGTKVEVGEEMVEGYHLCVGGGYGAEQGVGRRLLESLPFDDIPPIVERLLQHYLDAREGPDESFAAFTRRHAVEELRAIVELQTATA